ncbi:hypothetical protein SEPL_369 [Salmonella phage SE_PL]|nr:hypothetical protein 7t3_0205 [Salmonella phage 7t3]QIG62982.1 hypothetical protein SEPL_369 [Salmonella phage SE_PL]WNV47159.1 hypothetical protein [Klebsiella phage fENko-Kae01]WNV47674.1 hypothetical protein [Klebsiella phage fENko-Kae01]
MTTYRVEGCLGVTIGSVSTIDDATALVLKQIPISAKTTAQLAGKLSRKAVGGKVYVDYGGTGCTVFVE